MTLFKKLIAKNKKIEPRRLNLADYNENREEVDLLAEKMFNDLKKINLKQEEQILNMKLREKEFDAQEHNYCCLRVLSNSKEFAERIAKLMRFTRVDVLFFAERDCLSSKELKRLVVDLTEIKRLIIYSTLKLFNVEKATDLDWCGEFETYSALGDQESQLIELVKKMLRVNSMIVDVVANNCNVDKKKVMSLLRVDGIKDKRIPRVL